MLRIFWLIFVIFLTFNYSGCNSQDAALTIRGALAIPPTPPSSISYNSVSTNPNLTPWVTWGDASDRSNTGLDSYEISIGSSRCATDVVDWFNLKSTLNFTTSNLDYAFTTTTPFVSGSTYYVNVRAKDNYNQFGAATCGDGFLYAGTGLRQTSYIKAVNVNAADLYGTDVKIDGDTMIVGAPIEASNQTTITNGASASTNNSLPGAGAVYVYRKVAGVWQQEAYLKPPNPDALDYFGNRIALSGDTIAVASVQEGSCQTTITNGVTASGDNGCSKAGAVYIYQRNGTSWTQQAYIKASNAGMNDAFGFSVALHNDTLVVGAPGEDSITAGVSNGTMVATDDLSTNSGAVFVYKRSGVSWTQEAYIKAINNNAEDRFGCSVSVDVDTIAASACWENSNQTTITNGPTASSDVSASFAGAVFVYKRTGVNWAQEAYIKAANATSANYFGSSLDFKGDTLAVGSFHQASRDQTITNGPTASSDVSASFAGAVYVYKRTGVNWAQEAFIKASNAATNYRFGTAISLSEDRLAVTSPNESSSGFTVENRATSIQNSNQLYSGATYLYERSGATWRQISYIKAVNSYASLQFGTSVSVTSRTVVVGASSEYSSTNTITNGPTASTDSGAINAGAVYIYGE